MSMREREKPRQESDIERAYRQLSVATTPEEQLATVPAGYVLTTVEGMLFFKRDETPRSWTERPDARIEGREDLLVQKSPVDASRGRTVRKIITTGNGGRY